MTIQELCALAQSIGFEHAGPLDPATIELKEEVREMCASGKCAVYDKRWSCPPGCGTLDECRELLKGIVKLDTAVQYIVALGKRNLLWDLLPDLIEKNVIAVEVAENA